MALRFRILPSQDGGPPSGVAPGEAVAPAEERAFEILADPDQIRLGRQPGLEIELPFASVSTVHARITRGQTPGDWWLEDLGSTNGTWLEGTRLAARRPAPLRAGQRLRIATVEMLFDGWSATARGSEGTASLARRLISDLFGATRGETPALQVDAGTAEPRHLALVDSDRPYLVGRGDSCDVVVSGEAVSREHAVFVRRWDRVTVSDQGSRNGVVVNGARIDGEHELTDGDRIEIGPVSLRFTDPQSRYLTRLRNIADVPEVPDAQARPRRPTPPVPARVIPSAIARPRRRVGRRLLFLAIALVAVTAVAALAALLISV
jgi:pSer/pThr/pTyr-binding forkhead associated (FHA) protein